MRVTSSGLVTRPLTAVESPPPPPAAPPAVPPPSSASSSTLGDSRQGTSGLERLLVHVLFDPETAWAGEAPLDTAHRSWSSIQDPHITIGLEQFEDTLSGDFTLARNQDATFVIEARQEAVPGVPKAVVNTAVALRDGTTTITYSARTKQLLVDGDVWTGQSPLPGGTRVFSHGKGFWIQTTRGDVLQIAQRQGYLDLFGRLGPDRREGEIRGAIGVFDNTDDGRSHLMRDKRQAPTIEALIADWRVTDDEQLLAPGSDVTQELVALFKPVPASVWQVGQEFWLDRPAVWSLPVKWAIAWILEGCEPGKKKPTTPNWSHGIPSIKVAEPVVAIRIVPKEDPTTIWVAVRPHGELSSILLGLVAPWHSLVAAVTSWWLVVIAKAGRQPSPPEAVLEAQGGRGGITTGGGRLGQEPGMPPQGPRVAKNAPDVTAGLTGESKPEATAVRENPTAQAPGRQNATPATPESGAAGGGVWRLKIVRLLFIRLRNLQRARQASARARRLESRQQPAGA